MRAAPNGNVVGRSEYLDRLARIKSAAAPADTQAAYASRGRAGAQPGCPAPFMMDAPGGVEVPADRMQSIASM